MPTFFEGDTFISSQTLNLAETGTYTEDGLTFLVEATGGTVVFSQSTGSLDFTATGGNGAKFDLDFIQSSTRAGFFPTVVFGFGPISGALIEVFTPGNAFTFTDSIASNSTTLNPALITSLRFTLSPGGSASLTSLTAPNIFVSCFLEGTSLLGPKEDIAVEALQPGDQLTLADGGVTTVKWVGHRRVDTALEHPTQVNPICITAGTLGNVRDLYLSPDHALMIDGVLYDASVLVNGDTVYQVPQMPQNGFTYYHVETQAHEVILAEGVPVETFLDARPHPAFDNEAERDSAPGISKMDAPRISSARLVPQHVKDMLRGQRVA